MTAVQQGARLDRSGAIAVITLAAPPVNLLGHAMRAALELALDTCLADPSVRAIVISAEGKFFSAGADIREFGGAPRPPLLADICRRIEMAPVPIIGLLQGLALGGGAELVLATHYRLAGPTGAIAMPEMRLGLVPGAGGTQRLPRLLGAEAAMLLMTTGQQLDAAAASEIGVIDSVLSDPTPAAAIAFAEALLAEGLGPRPTLALTEFTSRGAVWLAAVAEARANLPDRPIQAQRYLVDCVEAALLLPPAAGLDFERSAFMECLASPESVALRHLFLAERHIPAKLGIRSPDGTISLRVTGKAVAVRLNGALRRAEAALLRAGAAPGLVSQAIAALCLASRGVPSDSIRNPGPLGDLATIQRACIAAVMAEGGRMLEKGAMPRAADVDVVAVAGAGWPRVSGGPMHAAARVGLPRLLKEMEALAALDPVWSPPSPLRDAVKGDRGFDANEPPPALRPVSPG